MSLRIGGMPEDWLLARIVPIFKAGNKLLAENYWPISITCTTCKMLEHIISKHLVEYIENNLFYNKQHGFHQCLSTVTQLLEVSHAFGVAINKEQIDVIAIDFSKAFVRMCHTKLIEKLYKLGVNTQIVKWIHAYLTNKSNMFK